MYKALTKLLPLAHPVALLLTIHHLVPQAISVLRCAWLGLGLRLTTDPYYCSPYYSLTLPLPPIAQRYSYFTTTLTLLLTELPLPPFGVVGCPVAAFTTYSITAAQLGTTGTSHSWPPSPSTTCHTAGHA